MSRYKNAKAFVHIIKLTKYFLSSRGYKENKDAEKWHHRSHASITRKPLWDFCIRQRDFMILYIEEIENIVIIPEQFKIHCNRSISCQLQCTSLEVTREETPDPSALSYVTQNYLLNKNRSLKPHKSISTKKKIRGSCLD